MANECDKVSGMLRNYLDNRLSKLESDKVEAHITGCSDCMGKLDTLSPFYKDVDRDQEEGEIFRPEPESVLRPFRDTGLSRKLFDEE